jgi:uncharacterized protein
LKLRKNIDMSSNPSHNEDEYFVRQEFERRQKEEVEKRKQLEKKEKEKLKELHYMHCPKCGMQLIEINYKGIAIDKCSSCEGVWLDEGELEAISDMEQGAFVKLFGAFKKK